MTNDNEQINIEEQIKDITEQLKKLRAILTENVSKEQFEEVSDIIANLEAVKERLEKEANNKLVEEFIKSYETSSSEDLENNNNLISDENAKKVKSICGDTNLVDVQKEITTLDELKKSFTFKDMTR